MKSMTEGRPLPLIAGFALPLLLGNLFQQTYNLADAAIVGRLLGPGALAGVGASSSVQFLVLGFCLGSCAGFAIPAAQCFGAGDYAAVRRCVFHAAVLTAAIAVLFTTICALLCPVVLDALRVPADIRSDAGTYLLIIFLGIPFMMLYNLLACLLRAVGDSRTPFLFLILSTVLNIILDLTTIALFGMGVAGAALSTVAAQAVSGILCGVHILRHTPWLLPDRDSRRFSGRTARGMLMMGLPMGLQFSITAIGSMTMQSANNSLGSTYVSGFTAGMRIKQFMISPFDALSTGVSTFCSQNLGAKRPDRIREGVRLGYIAGLLYGIASGLLLILAGRTLSMLFVSDPAVLDASARYLRAMGFFWWLIAPLSVARITTQGLGYTNLAMFSGVMEMIGRIIVSTLFVPVYGYTAVCYTDQTAWFLAAAYNVPVCAWCMRRIEARLRTEAAAPENP